MLELHNQRSIKLEAYVPDLAFSPSGDLFFADNRSRVWRLPSASASPEQIYTSKEKVLYDSIEFCFDSVFVVGWYKDTAKLVRFDMSGNFVSEISLTTPIYRLYAADNRLFCATNQGIAEVDSNLRLSNLKNSPSCRGICAYPSPGSLWFWGTSIGIYSLMDGKQNVLGHYRSAQDIQTVCSTDDAVCWIDQELHIIRDEKIETYAPTFFSGARLTYLPWLKTMLYVGNVASTFSTEAMKLQMVFEPGIAVCSSRVHKMIAINNKGVLSVYS